MQMFAVAHQWQMSPPARWPEPRSLRHKRLGCSNCSISQVFADQSSQEYEHAEKPNDLSHAKLLLGRLLQASVHDTLCRCSEGGDCTAITCHGQMEDHRHARTVWVHTEVFTRSPWFEGYSTMWCGFVYGTDPATPDCTVHVYSTSTALRMHVRVLLPAGSARWQKPRKKTFPALRLVLSSQICTPIKGPRHSG